MILEIQAEIRGNITISDDIEFKKQPYQITVFLEKERYYISIKKRITDYVEFLPKLEKDTNGDISICFPPNDFYNDITKTLQHIESFGAIDVGITRILWEEPLIRWISENKSEPISPLKEYKAERQNKRGSDIITQKWLYDTMLYEKQMEDLYIPFSFYRDGSNLFSEYRYQSAFCSFYMMLEYFFIEEKWGIKNDAYKRKSCLNKCLTKTLGTLQRFENHYEWLLKTLKERNKEYSVEGLLFILNLFRNNLSHAKDKSRNRNVFNEDEYFSLVYITRMVCIYVSIKKRLLPFVKKSEIESFLNN